MPLAAGQGRVTRRQCDRAPTSLDHPPGSGPWSHQVDAAGWCRSSCVTVKTGVVLLYVHFAVPHVFFTELLELCWSYRSIAISARAKYRMRGGNRRWKWSRWLVIFGEKYVQSSKMNTIHGVRASALRSLAATHTTTCRATSRVAKFTGKKSQGRRAPSAQGCAGRRV